MLLVPLFALSCAAFAPPRALPRSPRARLLRAAADLDVVVVGSANHDLSCRVASLPAEGETTQGSDFTTTFGGKGANQAVIAARVGARVAMCAKVGRDAFGDEQIENFRANGVDDAAVLRAPSVPTGVAQITVDDKGANTIVVVAGANGELSEEDIETCAAPLIARAKVVVVQNEVPPATSAAALRAARAAGATGILNPAPAGGAAALQALAPLLPLADIIVPNEVELGQLAEAAAETDEEIGAACEQLIAKLSHDGTTLVVTAGARGAFVARAGSPLTLVPTRALKKDQVVDTVGAGDAFVGAFASYLARGASLDEAVRRGCLVASLSVQNRGAQASYPDRAALDDELRLPADGAPLL